MCRHGIQPFKVQLICHDRLEGIAYLARTGSKSRPDTCGLKERWHQPRRQWYRHVAGSMVMVLTDMKQQNYTDAVKVMGLRRRYQGQALLNEGAANQSGYFIESIILSFDSLV